MHVQATAASWKCPDGHIVDYDGGRDGLFSLRQKDKSGRLLLFTRGVCDELVSFVFHSRSTYVAATSYFSATKRSFSLCRQYITILGRMFVATLRIAPEAFKCPLCGDHPEYVVIDGQSLGFRRRTDMHIVRPALLLPVLPLNVELLCILPTATLRRAVRKVLRCADPLNKVELAALRSWRAAQRGTGRHGRKRGRVNRDVYIPAADLFFTFFSLEAAAESQPDSRIDDESAGSTDSHADMRDNGQDGDVDARESTDHSQTGGDAAAVPEPQASSSSQWHTRSGPCSPRFQTLPKDDIMGWAAVRTFLLAMLGDPVVSLFAGLDQEPVLKLATALQSDSSTEWHSVCEPANDVVFVSNFLGRLGTHIGENRVLRAAVGRLVEFVVKLEDILDDKFKTAAKQAADNDVGLNLDYCDRWMGKPTHADFQAFVAEHPAFKGKNLDSVYSCFEYFGNLPRVRPAIFAIKAKRSKRASEGRARQAKRWRRSSQADEEDENDRCNKAFPKHQDLTAGVFNVVCPHVVTLGFRVMFDAESVGDALSVILERFPTLPRVIFYDVGCKLDRNAFRRVRTIIRNHKVKIVLDRVHARGHTCSPIYFPNEALGRTNGVATQAAEVQHSVSVKFRSHLAYMSPESFMAHRLVQLSMMNLAASFKVQHPESKEENEDVDLAPYYHAYISKSCSRSHDCPCRAPRQ